MAATKKEPAGLAGGFLYTKRYCPKFREVQKKRDKNKINILPSLPIITPTQSSPLSPFPHFCKYDPHKRQKALAVALEYVRQGYWFCDEAQKRIPELPNADEIFAKLEKQK